MSVEEIRNVLKYYYADDYDCSDCPAKDECSKIHVNTCDETIMEVTLEKLKKEGINK